MCVCVYFEIINFELELYMCVCVYMYTEKYIFIAYYSTNAYFRIALILKKNKKITFYV